MSAQQTAQVARQVIRLWNQEPPLTLKQIGKQAGMGHKRVKQILISNGASTGRERWIRPDNRTRLAQSLGLSRGYISYVLNGKREPTLSVAAAISRKLGISIDDLHRQMQRAATVQAN